jgi:hypothetical protein
MTSPGSPADLIDAARESTSAFAVRAAGAARSGAGSAAKRLEAADVPLEALADAARQLSALSQHYFVRMMDQSVINMRGLITEGAQRLRRAAQAHDVSSLYREQIERWPESRKRLARDARATWTILSGAGGEIAMLARATFERLASGANTRTTKARRTSATTATSKAKKKRRSRRVP